MVLPVSLIVLGAFGLIIPFIGPLFEFGMGPDPAWEWTEARFVRHVIPGAAVIAGGLLLLPRHRAAWGIGTALALAGGIWFVLAPVVLGRVVEGMPAFIDILRPTVYHYGIGVLIAVLGGFALGRVSAAATRPGGPPEIPERERRPEAPPRELAGRR